VKSVGDRRNSGENSDGGRDSREVERWLDGTVQAAAGCMDNKEDITVDTVPDGSTGGVPAMGAKPEGRQGGGQTGDSLSGCSMTYNGQQSKQPGRRGGRQARKGDHGSKHSQRARDVDCKGDISSQTVGPAAMQPNHGVSPIAPPCPHALPAADIVMATEACAQFVPMTVDTSIGGVHVQPLVDTGAGVSLIHTMTLEHLQAQGIKCVVHQHQGARIVGVNGDKVATLGFM
jgi:hypothetical protein